MESKHLSTEEVLAGGDAGGDLDAVAALAVDDLLGAPDTVVVAVLLDLEPTAADTRVGGGVVDLLEVGHGGALVGDVHDVVGGRAGGGEHVAPDGGHVLTSLDGDDLGGGGGRVGSTVAGDRGRVDILNGAVVAGHTDTTTNTVVDTVHLEGGEDGVGARGGGKEDRGELHGDGGWSLREWSR